MAEVTVVPPVLDQVPNTGRVSALVSLATVNVPELAVRLEADRLPPPTVRLRLVPAVPVTVPVIVPCVTDIDPVPLFNDMPESPCKVPPPVTVNPLAPLIARVELPRIVPALETCSELMVIA